MNSSSPTVIIVSPAPSTARTPNRVTSLPALRATNRIVSVIGRNVSPAFSGDSPSTCCRYRELRYHIGNSAALNTTTIRFESCSVFVRSLNGISGSDANRVSITTNATSSTSPPMIGPSA